MPQIDTTTVLLIVIILIFACLFLAAFIKKLSDFLNQLKYINMEIDRNMGDTREYWKRKKRRLWLTWIPFVRG